MSEDIAVTVSEHKWGDGLEARIIPGEKSNLYYYVAKHKGVELARERVPLFVLNMGETARGKYLLREIAKKLSKRIGSTHDITLHQRVDL